MMNKNDVKKGTTLENKCPCCTASISFNPRIGKWKCEYCGSVFNLDEMKKHSNNAANHESNNVNTNESIDDSQYVTYHCESCGAEIITDEQTSATFCVYCGATAILKNKLIGKFAPEYIIPFKKTKEDSIEAFKTLSKGRALVPKAFTSEQNITKIRGVYVPFWLYDVKASGDLHMIGTRSTSWTTASKHYVKTDKYKVVRGGDVIFNKIPVDGSKRFDNDIMNSLEPFDFQELVKYNHAYLSGFYAEKYDENNEDLFKCAKERAINSTIEKFKDETTGYETLNVESNNFKAMEVRKAYALLPVWMVNVKYKDKMHLFAMNGQTGEFIGDIPLDVPRAIYYAITIFIIIMTICIFISYISSGVWV